MCECASGNLSGEKRRSSVCVAVRSALSRAPAVYLVYRLALIARPSPKLRLFPQFTQKHSPTPPPSPLHPSLNQVLPLRCIQDVHSRHRGPIDSRSREDQPKDVVLKCATTIGKGDYSGRTLNMSRLTQGCLGTRILL